MEKYTPIKEDLVYESKGYRIYSKGSNVNGNLTAALDIIEIGLSGLPTITATLAKKEFQKIATMLEKDLQRAIAKTNKNYE